MPKLRKRLIGIFLSLMSWFLYIGATHSEILEDPRGFYIIAKSRITGKSSAEPQELSAYRLQPPLSVRQYARRYIPNMTGLNRYALDVQGKKRTYYSYTPSSLTASTKTPAIILLHEVGRTGASIADKWRNTSERHSLKLFAPDGFHNGKMNLWSYADDKPFIRVLLDVIKADPQVDPDHIYLFGHAGGAIIGLLFGADFSRDFAAVSFHAGMIIDPQELPVLRIARRKIPACFFNGTYDKAVPMAKGREAAQALADAGHRTVFAELIGHTHWYYTLGDWINEKALQCMTSLQPVATTSSAP